MINPLLLSICAFLMLMLLFVFLGYRFFYKPGKFLRQLGRPVITEQKHIILDLSTETESSTIVTFLQQIGSKVPSSEADIATLKTNLIRGGFRSEAAVPVFFGLRIVATLAMLFLVILAEPKLPANAVMKMALMVSGCSCGWILPRFFLEKRVAKRQDVLRLSLPDALDLLVVSVEAGLGLDQAISHVAKELDVSHPELSEEMSMVMLEMRAGKRRADALRNFADRTGEDEIRKLVAILI